VLHFKLPLYYVIEFGSSLFYIFRCFERDVEPYIFFDLISEFFPLCFAVVQFWWLLTSYNVCLDDWDYWCDLMFSLDCILYLSNYMRIL
jgi:hypothetical protein